MHFFTPARLALLVGLLLGMSSQAHAAPTCFAADGWYLKTAVNNFIGGTWNDGGEYGPIENWCTSKVTTMRQLFFRKGSFNADISQWDTSSVTDMYEMFGEAKDFNADISEWDTSSVTDMKYMFGSAEAFNVDISEWDTSKVTTMYGLFLTAHSFNQDIGGWNTSSVTNMYAMFHGAIVFSQNLTRWDTSKVNRMDSMFVYAYDFNGDVSGWDTSSVTKFNGMFGQSKFNGDISGWDTSKGQYFSQTFARTPFNGDISGWDTSSAINMGAMFHASEFNRDTSGWDTSKVTSMGNMFQEAKSFNQDLSNWDTSSVTVMAQMFWQAESFNQDLSRWDTSSVKNFYNMFGAAKVFNQDISGWDISPASNLHSMFNGASVFNQNLCAWKDKFPYGANSGNIFLNSGCDNKVTPTSSDSAFCAGTADDCQAYTHPPTPSPTQKYPPTQSPTDSPTPAIKSWDLELTSVDTDFDKDSVDEITLNYKIGKDRKYKVFVLTDQCKEAITPEGVINQTSSVSDIVDDTSNEDLKVSVDIDKKVLVGSNILFGNLLKLCLKVVLVSGEGDNERVIKKLERDIQVALDFKNEFETAEEAKFSQITLGSNETTSTVDDYIKACTCDGNNDPFECNTNALGVDDYLNVCLESLDADMQINYVDSLKMVQDGNTLNIVSSGSGLVDGSISSLSTRADDSGVHIASVIPASFFSYESSGTAEVSGVVFLKLSGSRRRLAVEMDRALQSVGDQESAFSMEVQLEKNALEVDADSNGAVYAVKIGVLVGLLAAAVVTASTLMMW